MEIIFWLLAILLSLAAGYWVYRADRKRAVPYPWLTSALRAAVVFLTCILLLTPLIIVKKNDTQKPVVLFLQDNSESIATALHRDSVGYRKNAEELLKKLGGDYRVVKWGFGNTVQKDTLFDYRQPATNISQAITEAIEYYGQQNLGAVILATDGRFNEGSNPPFQDLAYQGSLYTVAIGDSAMQKDLRVSAVYANKTVLLNSQFEIKADLVADGCEGYHDRVRLREVNGGTSEDEPLNITTEAFDKTVAFTVKADRIGLHHYVIEAPEVEGEANTNNNRKDIFVEVVSEKKNILLLAAAPHPDINAIRDALSGLESYALTIKTADAIPADLSGYQIIILHALPAGNQSQTVKKPVWYIVGNGTNIAPINQAQVATLNVNTLNLQNNFAQYNTSFNAFTLPPNIHAVMDKIPPLASPAGTVQPAANALVLFSSRSSKQPLWLLEQRREPQALLIGEGLWRWRMYEYRYFKSHQVVDELIRQTISFLAANVNEVPFRVELSKYIWSDRETVSFGAYLLNASNEHVNTPDVQLVVADSAGNKQSYDFEKSGDAYKINIGTRSSGTYSYTAKTIYDGKSYTASGSFSVQNMPVEMMESGANYPMLYALAKKYNGSLVPSGQITSLYDSIRLNNIIKPVIQSREETIPLVDWKWYFFLILLFAVAEWLLRKYWMAQ
ncbi:MAG TPA: vWA domain-containing protein [Flavipsychrobacter sp.]|nr:vWA domain-containing protein [Flavipsychrobacter sp.]